MSERGSNSILEECEALVREKLETLEEEYEPEERPREIEFHINDFVRRTRSPRPTLYGHGIYSHFLAEYPESVEYERHKATLRFDVETYIENHVGNGESSPEG